jgi:hypothetical protein
MKLINLIIIIFLIIVLTFILTRTLPPLPIINSCKIDSDCGESAQCQANVCVSDQLLAQLLIAQNNAVTAYTAIDALYTQLDYNKDTYASDNYENFMSSVSKAGQAVGTYKNSILLATYGGSGGNSGADGYVALGVLVNAITLSGSISTYSQTLIGTFTSLSTDIPISYVEDAVSAISVASTDANNLYQMVFL